jgi:hypothetical protein
MTSAISKDLNKREEKSIWSLNNNYRIRISK